MNSLWFIHLPSYAMQSGSKAPACLQSAYEFLVKIQKMKLQPTDEVSYFVCSFCNMDDVRPHPDFTILPQHTSIK